MIRFLDFNDYFINNYVIMSDNKPEGGAEHLLKRRTELMIAGNNKKQNTLSL